ncbi:MAG: sigma-54-dependent Fis family transcriptional regulator [Candidatus Latescibacteria bacterium]|nr:sigma-54-dependent Fis family transcriptional regulator [Candidatus Latescibacterota bacterium]
MSKRILVVDDEQSMRDTLQIMLEKQNFEVETAENGKKALEFIEKEQGDFDLIITDMKMPELNGIGLIEEVNKIYEIPIIIMTAHATKDQAITALNLGAAFFVEKPFKNEELLNFVRQSIKMEDLIRENKGLKANLKRKTGLDMLIGTSEKMRELKDMIHRIASSESTILITGESGTGKEVSARAIHDLSPRSGRSFVAINCGAIPSELLESELFGHLKGSFTGAVRDKDGLMKIADGGTFFLDEVGNTPPSVQIKILRAIQEKEIMPVGGNAPIKVDIRLIAATNENLEDAIKHGEFRKDLYYRLNVINLHIPPLRERPDDIELLFTHFLKIKDPTGEISNRRFRQQDMDILKEYSWPGNIRELENVVERIVAISGSGNVGFDVLPEHMRNPQKTQQLVSEQPQKIPNMEEIEKAYIHWILTQNNGQKQKAAEILGIGRSTLDRKIEKYGL